MDAESQQVEELKAEIERLLLKHAKGQNTLLVALEAATKEIERLKRELVKAYSDITYQRTLMTELADALSWYVEPETDNGLIQSAREATK